MAKFTPQVLLGGAATSSTWGTGITLLASFSIAFALNASLTHEARAQAVYSTGTRVQEVPGSPPQDHDTDAQLAISSSSASAVTGGEFGQVSGVSSAFGNAIASVSGLGVEANAQMTQLGAAYSGGPDNENYAQVTLNDVTITCSGTSCGGIKLVNGSLNVFTAGTVSLTASAAPASPIPGDSRVESFSAGSYANVYVGGTLTDNISFNYLFSTSYSQSESDTTTGSGSLPPTDSSSASNNNITQILPGSGMTLTTSVFALPVGTPFDLTLLLDAQAWAAFDGFPFSDPLVLSATADMNYYDTLSFPTSGPVFNLPDGFTINSVEGDIVNNEFAPATPLPPTWTMMLIGLAGLGFISHRRRKQTPALAV